MWERGWLGQEHAGEIIAPVVGDPRRACVGEGLTFLGLCHLCLIPWKGFIINNAPLLKCSTVPLLSLDNNFQCQSCLGTCDKHGLLDPPGSRQSLWSRLEDIQGKVLLRGGFCPHPNYFYFFAIFNKNYLGRMEGVADERGVYIIPPSLLTNSSHLPPCEIFFLLKDVFIFISCVQACCLHVFQCTMCLRCPKGQERALHLLKLE